MSVVTNLSRVLKSLVSRKLKSPKTQVIVGYTADYAMRIHEDLAMNHPNGGQAKYLEQPAREMQSKLAKEVQKDMMNGATLETSLLKAGLKLQAASQKLVPVDTGNLRASAYTKVENKS